MHPDDLDDFDLSDPLGPMRAFLDLDPEDMIEALAEVWALGDRASVEEIAHLIAGLVEQGATPTAAAELLTRAEDRAHELRRPRKPRARPIVGES